MRVKLYKDDKVRMISSKAVYKVMVKALLKNTKVRRKQEFLWVMGLSTNLNAKFIELVAIGGINIVGVKAVELFTFAIRKRCNRIILIHNHPSGNTTPSKDDIAFTKAMQQAAEILGIEILDHLIISETSYYSFEDERILN